MKSGQGDLKSIYLPRASCPNTHKRKNMKLQFLGAQKNSINHCGKLQLHWAQQQYFNAIVRSSVKINDLITWDESETNDRIHIL